MTRVTLDEGNFRRLVGGLSVRVADGVEIVLNPRIGWVKLTRAILDAIAPPDPVPGGPLDPPQAKEFLPAPRRRR